MLGPVDQAPAAPRGRAAACRARSRAAASAGFSIPAAAWLRGPLLPFAREVLSADAAARAAACSTPAAVQRLLDRHASGAEDLSRQLWGLMAFTLWQQRAAA